jgi:hypothetical protein
MRLFWSTWRVVSGITAVTLLIPFFVEAAARFALAQTPLATTVLDIQTPETLCEKVTFARKFVGRKILIVGDSLAFGRAMRDHGDTKWRDHELGAALGRTLPQSDQPTLILNLGLNGGLPADQVVILKLLSGVVFDAIISTISIRSFATDFATDKTSFSRAWMMQARCPYVQTGVQTGPTSVLAGFDQMALSTSALLRSRDLIQRALFDGTPRDFFSELAARLQTREVAKHPFPGPEDPQVLLLAKGRFARISLDEPHAQVAALKEFRRLSKVAAHKVIFVYGKEASKLLPSLISKATYAGHRQRLRVLVAPDDSVAYLDQLEIPSARYIDYVHVDAEGYRLIATEIAAAIGL